MDTAWVVHSFWHSFRRYIGAQVYSTESAYIACLKKKEKAYSKIMLPIRVNFVWAFWMTSHWFSSGSHSAQHFIGNLDDWSLLPDLVSSVNLQRAHSVLLSRLLTKTLITIGTSTAPLGKSLATSCQLDFVPLITTLSAQQPSQVSTHYIPYLSKPDLTNSAIGKQWVTVSETFLKAKWRTPQCSS